LKLAGADPGFQADRILASVVLPAPERYPDPAQRALFYQRILDSVRSLTGVESAGTVDALPFSGENHGGMVSNSEATAAQTGSQLIAEIDVVGGDYLQTMGVLLLEGRWFRDEEMSESSDAVIVSDFTARRLWPAASAVGRRVCVFCTPENPRNWKRVIGVVSGMDHAALNEPAKGNVYLAAGAMRSAVFLVVRTRENSEASHKHLEQQIRRAIAAIDPHQPVFLSASMRALVADSVADRKFIATLLGITGWLALLMAAAGVYAVISYTTSRRTPEIGIRVALGATPANVHLLIFRQGFGAVAVGLTVGFCGVLPVMHGLRGFLTGLETRNAIYLWIAILLVTLAAGIACWIPARRAARVDPMRALRQE